MLLPLLTACEMKKDLFGGGVKEEAPSYDNLGLLDIEIQAEREAELRADGSVSVEESNTLKPDEFAIEIADSTGQVVKSFPSLAAMKEAGELLLPVGTYSVHAAYGSDVNAGFNSPYYAGDTTCVVSEKEVSTVVTKCVLQNKKVQFAVSDEFLSQFSSDYSIVVDNGLGVLTLTPEQLGSAFFKNTGTLRFSLYATTYDGQVHTYTSDLSGDEQVLAHNNIYVELGAVPTIPDQPGGVDPEEPEEPEMPEDPDEPEPEEPDQPKPDVPVTPVIKVDVTLIEKDYVIEIPSNFVENSKPGTGGGDTPSTPETPDNPGEGGGATVAKPSIKGDGFNIDSPVSLTPANSNSLKVRIAISTPGKLASLQVTIKSAVLEPLLVDMKLGTSFDMCNLSAEQKGILTDLGLAIPPKGSTSTVFDLTAFMPLIAILDPGNYVFEMKVADQAGQSTTKTLTVKLTK